MNRDQAYTLIRQTFTQGFDRSRFSTLAVNLLNRIDESKTQSWNKQYIKDAFKDHVHRYERLGTYTSPDGEKLDVLIVHLAEGSKLERARTAIRNFVAHHLKTRDEKDAALVAFVSPTEQQWRFSYVKMEYTTVEKDSGKIGVEERLTPARRFSYLVGEGESCHTAQTRFLGLLQNMHVDPKLADIENAFSVEAVTKEFFTRYAQLFGEIHKALEGIIEKESILQTEFAAKSINPVDFAKKLMGQIVFLYFLQKKGWLGVAKGQGWGAGPHDFLRRLANSEYGKYDNFFNDILEPLFYDTLATDRGHDAWCTHFNCRIPFLNGGLFEPLGNYDWQNADIILPNRLFTNNDFVEEGITGTGVLNVFDRYNFTVNEAEPLEKEVAIDPEMLGKVFENLIEKNRRKGLGAYYTPREIVHYMCQESLVNYLDTALNKDNGTVPRKDIEIFVHLGEQAAHYETARLSRTKSYKPELPGTIETHARLIDEKLTDITVCDPAVGSGAFPVGMMTEIVRARTALTPYFNDIHERTSYHFKRHAIQSCLYGVDIDLGAVETAKLRLWLSLVVDEEDVQQIKPLPNLDYKIVAGNSLLGVERNIFNDAVFQELEKLKPQYFDETDPNKKASLKQQIDDLIHQLTNGKEIFDFEVWFSEVFHRNGGFDVVISNPPYVVSKDKALREIYKESVYGRPNLYGFFIHRSLKTVLSEQGVLTFINPRTLLADSYCSALRKYILKLGTVLLVLNIVDRRNVFETVLQSTIVNIFSRNNMVDIVRVKNIKTKEEIAVRNEIKIKKSDFLFGPPSNPIFIVAESQETYSIIRKLAKLPTFSQVGLTFTTGKIQWDLYKTVLSQNPNKLPTRLVWAENIQRFYFAEARLRTDKQFINGMLKTGSPIKHKTIIVQRITAVEQLFRIISTIVSPEDFGFPIQSENHTSYLEDNINSINLCFVLGLLNSRLFDFVFRHINSNTQVSAGELNGLPFPNDLTKNSTDAFVGLVDKILTLKKLNPKADTTTLESEIDYLVYNLYDLTEDEIAIVEGMSSREPTTV
jgi:type I restriction-modification system DNA methylase subunit